MTKREVATLAKAEAPAVVKSEEERRAEWMAEDIKFEFNNLEEPGVPIKFSFGPTSDIKSYYLLHGGKYTHPRSLVQHLESSVIPIWGYKPDGSGAMVKNLEGHKSRFQCRQLFE